MDCEKACCHQNALSASKSTRGDNAIVRNEVRFGRLKWSDIQNMFERIHPRMNQTGHPSLATFHRHICDGALFRANPAAKLGL